MKPFLFLLASVLLTQCSHKAFRSDGAPNLDGTWTMACAMDTHTGGYHTREYEFDAQDFRLTKMAFEDNRCKNLVATTRVKGQYVVGLAYAKRTPKEFPIDYSVERIELSLHTANGVKEARQKGIGNFLKWELNTPHEVTGQPVNDGVSRSGSESDQFFAASDTGLGVISIDRDSIRASHWGLDVGVKAKFLDSSLRDAMTLDYVFKRK